MRAKGCLDFSQLDAVSPQFDLMIQAAEKFDSSIRQMARQISRPVE